MVFSALSAFFSEEGWNCRLQKTPRAEGGDKVPAVWTQGSRQVSLSKVPEILEFVAFGDPGGFFQQFSRNFPGTFLHNSRKDPRSSHSLLEFSDLLFAQRAL